MTKKTYNVVLKELKELMGVDSPAALLEAVKDLRRSERAQRERADSTASVLVMFRLTEPAEIVAVLPTANCTVSVDRIDRTRNVFTWLSNNFLEPQRAALERAAQQQAEQRAVEGLKAKLRAAGVDVEELLAQAEETGKGGEKT